MTTKNRLAQEKSPYLLQHAANPVDWFPWGDEAFNRARRENRPIFLSVGYSTCHWCHVMERESFEDDEVAAFMNEHLVNVKVDREEHPDVDQIYMAAVQRMTGQGGWPMSVFMTPELEPFYAGTYFPPRSRWGRPGFLDLLQALSDAWREDPKKLRAQGSQVRAVIAQKTEGELPEGLPSRTAIRAAITSMRQSFDKTWGGFGAAPKFPRSMSLQLLMREVSRRGDAEGDLMTMVQRTLDMMWRGGMYDHVGGGFARYSTDEKWLVPHFEKMLYDNALLIRAYSEAYQIDGNEDWRRVVTETVEWVTREMCHERGGFFSAQDADSEGEEGLFYLWNEAELNRVLGEEDAVIAARVFAVTEGANFEGANVLYLKTSLTEQARDAKLSDEDFRSRLDDIRSRLYKAREERIHPGLDDKILTSWNGLMIGALAFAGSVFNEPSYLERASAAAHFVCDELVESGDLKRRWRDDQAVLAGSLEDYAFFSQGLLELFQADGDPEWMTLALTLTERAMTLFEDPEDGGFFFTEKDRPNLIVRMKEPYDGATPSGNSVMILNLLALADLCDRQDFRDSAERALRASALEMNRHPMAYPLLLCALDDAYEGPEEAISFLPSGAEETRLLRVWRSHHRPGAVTVLVQPTTEERLNEMIPLLKGKGMQDGAETFWHCRTGVCELPEKTEEGLRVSLSRRARQ